MNLFNLLLTASPRQPPEPHRATSRILSSSQTGRPSPHCYWLYLPRKTAAAARCTSWHFWLAWAYGSSSVQPALFKHESKTCANIKRNVFSINHKNDFKALSPTIPSILNHMACNPGSQSCHLLSHILPL